MSSTGPTAFVLGGGGILGAAEVGMLRALLDRGITPDLVVGSSVGAMNGALLSADPSARTVERMTEAWSGITGRGVFSGSLAGQVHNLVRHGTFLHDNTRLRTLLEDNLGDSRFEDLAVRFECVAACIETASPRWFATGPLVPAVLASCAVPGLLPVVRIGQEHFLDGGLVRSVPIGRAVRLGARRVFVLQVGRLEEPLRVPRKPWEVALVSFEIARRHHFHEEVANLEEGVELHVLPSGSKVAPVSLRYRDMSSVPGRIDSAFHASCDYLDRVGI
jgi:NTE family protein